MFSEHFQQGDMVFAKRDLHSDGEVPGTEEGQLLVAKGARGMVVRVGHLEAEPDTPIYLVRFEDDSKELGLALGCLTDDLTQRLDASVEQPIL